MIVKTHVATNVGSTSLQGPWVTEQFDEALTLVRNWRQYVQEYYPNATEHRSAFKIGTRMAVRIIWSMESNEGVRFTDRIYVIQQP